jgi:hypothetical protein
MADQELGLVADGVLERLAAVNVEVADRIALDLAARRGRRVAQRGRRRRDGVLVADAETGSARSPCEPSAPGGEARRG